MKLRVLRARNRRISCCVGEVRAERADLRLDHGLRTVADGDHDDHGAHTDHDAEHREQRPHFVLQDARGRDLE